MPWSKGKSGNPKGRPPKSRALTDVLEAAGRKKGKLLASDAKQMQRAHILAERVWEGITTGIITFDERKIELDATDYIGLLKFAYTQIDGPPKSELDLTSDGEPLAIQITGVPSRAAPPSAGD
ncbi:MAG: hypothetical protein J0M07_32770 [Anaerolineae bacterium]|nr:hypothetical protein [Anaerolineae bacterium]